LIRRIALPIVAGQALVAAQPATLIAAHWSCGKRRKLAGATGLEKGLAEESERFEPRQNLSQLRLGFYAAEDQMRMVVKGR
jgi:hypothetical protein